jgi:hypothetical protein
LAGSFRITSGETNPLKILQIRNFGVKKPINMKLPTVGIIFFVRRCLAFDGTPKRMALTQNPSKLVVNLQADEAEQYQLLTMEFRRDRLHTSLGKTLDHSPALVLNADYSPLCHFPLSLWSWQDSLRAVFNGKAVVVSEYTNLLVRSVSCEFRLPSVIALKQYQKMPDKTPQLSRRNVYIRDGFRCQVRRRRLIMHDTRLTPYSYFKTRAIFRVFAHVSIYYCPGSLSVIFLLLYF